MKYSAAIGSLCVLVMMALCHRPSAGQEDLKKPESMEDSASYAIGLNMGESFKKQGAKISPQYLLRGLIDALEGRDRLLNADEARSAVARLQKENQRRRAMKDAGADKVGQAYLDQNKKREGVVTTASGLQYEILRAGKGENPKTTDRVVVHYRGTLIDGKQFDSSYDRGEPMTFGVTQVIPGWVEGLQLMKPGAKWKLFIPSNLAYGARGYPPLIPPNSSLIFDIELIEIEQTDTSFREPQVGQELR